MDLRKEKRDKLGEDKFVLFAQICKTYAIEMVNMSEDAACYFTYEWEDSGVIQCDNVSHNCISIHLLPLATSTPDSFYLSTTAVTFTD